MHDCLADAERPAGAGRQEDTDDCALVTLLFVQFLDHLAVAGATGRLRRIWLIL